MRFPIQRKHALSDTSPEPEKWPIFICYRRVDGQAIADALFQILHDHKFHYHVKGVSGKKREAQFDVYLDRERGADADYFANISSYIDSAKAFIIICTKGLIKEGGGSEDVALQEIELWLNATKTKGKRDAPILLTDAEHSLESIIPENIANRWPRLNVLPIHIVEEIQSDGSATCRIDSVATQQFVIRSLIDKSVERYRREQVFRRRWRYGLGFMTSFVVSALLLLTYEIFVSARENLVEQSRSQAREAEGLRISGNYFGSYVAALNSWPIDDSDIERQDAVVRDLLSEALTANFRVGTVNAPEGVYFVNSLYSTPPTSGDTYSFSEQSSSIVEEVSVVEVTEADRLETIIVTSSPISEHEIEIDLGGAISQQFSMMSDEFQEIHRRLEGRSSFNILAIHKNMSETVIGVDVGVRDQVDFRLLFGLNSEGEFTQRYAESGNQFSFISGSDFLAQETETELRFIDVITSNIVQSVPLEFRYDQSMSQCSQFDNQISRSALLDQGIRGLNLTATPNSTYITAYRVGSEILVYDISNGEVVASSCPFDGQAGAVFSPAPQMLLGWGLSWRTGIRVQYLGNERGHFTSNYSDRWDGRHENNWSWLNGANQRYSYVEIDSDGLVIGWPDMILNRQVEIYNPNENIFAFQDFPGGFEIYQTTSPLGYYYGGDPIENTNPALLNLEDWDPGAIEYTGFNYLLDYGGQFIQGPNPRNRHTIAVYAADTGDIIYEAEPGYFLPPSVLESSRSLSIVLTATGYTIRDVATGIELTHVFLPNQEGNYAINESDSTYIHLTSRRLFSVVRGNTDFAAVYYIDIDSLGTQDLISKLCSRLETYLISTSDDYLTGLAINNDSVLSECLRRRAIVIR